MHYQQQQLETPYVRQQEYGPDPDWTPDPDYFPNLMGTSLSKDISVKTFHENPITLSGDIRQIV